MAYHHLSNMAQVKRMKPDGTLYQKAAGTTDVLTSDTIDMLGFDAVQITGLLGAITATGTVGVVINQSLDGTTWVAAKDISGNAITVSVVAADAQKSWTLDFYRLEAGYRYLQVVQTRATANAAIDGLLALLYKAGNVPVALDATAKTVTPSKFNQTSH